MSNTRIYHSLSLKKLDPFLCEHLLYDLGTKEVVVDGDELLHNCLSPDHDDENPSASYNVEKHLFGCFSCGFAGDVLKLIMAVRKLSYVEAVDFLATYVGLKNVDQNTVSQHLLDQRKRDSLARIDNIYCTPQFNQKEVDLPFAFSTDWKSAKPEIQKYVKSRKFNSLVLKHFGIGYCNEGWWADRIVVPFVQWDKVVGFTTRSIHSKEEHAKLYPDRKYSRYAHKASTPIDQILYGLDASYKLEDPVFVEGSLDCIRMRSYGLNCYSTLSNNLSVAQAAIINHCFKGTIYIMPDNDKAGLVLVENFLELLSSQFTIAVCKYDKSAKDPDMLTREQALAALESAKNPLLLQKSSKQFVATSIKR